MSCTPTKLNQHKITKRSDGSLKVSSNLKVREGRPRTEQSHKGECDIRNIVRRYAKAGVPLTNPDVSSYSGENYVLPPLFTDAMRIVADANSTFASLPSKIRDRFQNDPSSFLEFMHNPANADEAVALGLATKRRVAPPPAVSEGKEKSPPKAPKTPPANDGGGQPKGGSDQ